MIPLAFLTVLGGAILLIAGVTDSSIASVAQGKPDHAGPKLHTGGGSSEPSIAASPGKNSSALAHAISQLGTPYRWGGELEKVAFDCSGLVQWSFGKAGIRLPRTAEEQFKATKRVGAGEAHEGDLVFFSNGHEISHVGILVSPGLMIDAPHTGSVVRYEHFPAAVGSAWGSDTVAGYGRA